MHKIDVHSDPKIQQLINNIDDLYRQDDMIAFKKQNDQLHTYAKVNNDMVASIIARYNDVDISFIEQDFNTCRQKLLELLPECEREGIDFYTLKIYNTLGIIESEQAFYYESFEFYTNAINIANAHPEYRYTGILLNNVGNLLVWLKEYDAALPYLKQAYHKSRVENSDTKSIMTTILINIIECYSYLRDEVKVKEWFEISFQYAEQDNEFSVIESLVITDHIMKSYELKDHHNITSQVKALIENAKRCPEFIYQFRSLLRALECCIKFDDKELCDEIIKVIELLDKDNQIDTFVFDYADLKIQYYNQFLKGHASLEVCESYMKSYYEQSRNEFKQMKQTYNHSLVVHAELAKAELDKDHIMTQKSILEKEVEMDNFTRLFNKVSVCDRIKKVLSEMQEQDTYALMFIDIDYFKKVNDIYGHDIGDQVLLEVVRILKEEINERVLVGRFGGDEFLLFLYPFKTHKEPLTLVERLVKKGRTVKVPGTKDQYISLSIGVAQSVGASTFDSLLKNADRALYKCKQKGRDDYYLKRLIKAFNK